MSVKKGKASGIKIKISGPQGIGKTTIAKLIADLFVDRGIESFIEGEPIESLRSFERQNAVAFLIKTKPTIEIETTNEE